MSEKKQTHEEIMDGMALAARVDTETGAPDAGGNLFANAGSLAHGWRCAQVFARSHIIPQHLQGKPNDCLIALHMSNQMGVDPLMVMQNMFIVKGTPGWKTQFMIARANALGAWEKRINWRSEGSGNDLVVTAYAVRSDGEKVQKSVSMKTAIADGWTRNDKYKSMPEDMLEYRAAAFLIRRHCPEATMGYMSTEELEDVNGRQSSGPSIGGPLTAAMLIVPPDPPGTVPIPDPRPETAGKSHTESMIDQELAAAVTASPLKDEDFSEFREAVRRSGLGKTEIDDFGREKFDKEINDLTIPQLAELTAWLDGGKSTDGPPEQAGLPEAGSEEPDPPAATDDELDRALKASGREFPDVADEMDPKLNLDVRGTKDVPEGRRAEFLAAARSISMEDDKS